jgi:DNA-binding Lrp family transcriptional regulator
MSCSAFDKFLIFLSLFLQDSIQFLQRVNNSSFKLDKLSEEFPSILKENISKLIEKIGIKATTETISEMCISHPQLSNRDMLHQARAVDYIDLRIIRILARDSRTHYKNIASAAGLTASAAKERINKMVSNGVIRSFVVFINPATFGYEELHILIVRNINKTIKEEDLIKKVSLLGDIYVHSENLGGSAIFAVFVKGITADKTAILSDLVKPANLEPISATYKPPTMKIKSSDLEIMKCLLSDPRMPVEDIAKETSLSTKTVRRRLEKMRENDVLHFSILPNLSSMKLTGYIEFAVLIHVNISSRQSILERIYRELEEYLFCIPNWYQREAICAVFFCANISTVNLVLRILESYDGVNNVESFLKTSVTVYQDWLKSEINKRIAVQKHSASSAAAAETEEAYKIR